MAGEGFDRRSFIKACAGVGAAGAAAAAGFGMLRPISDVNVNIEPISYPGLKVIKGSPAPYGLPLIPLSITENGEFKGVPDAAEDQLKWYKYCSHEKAPGTFSDFETDNLIRYYVTESQQAKQSDQWFSDKLDQVAKPSDFPDSEPKEAFSEFPGVGAPFQWRSKGVPKESTITGIIIKAPKDQIEFESRVPSSQAEDVRQNFFPEHPDDPESVFVACCSFCTHFCCVPGFHASQLAVSSGYPETIFCTCHLSRYDPFTIQTYNRTIFTFPEAAPGGGGGEGGGSGSESGGSGGHA